MKFVAALTYLFTVGACSVDALTGNDSTTEPKGRSSLRAGAAAVERQLAPNNKAAKKQKKPCLVLVQATEYEEQDKSELSLACLLDEDDEADEPQGNGKRIVKLSGLSVNEFEALGLESANALLSSTAGDDDDDDNELYDDELKVKPGKYKVEKKNMKDKAKGGVGFQRGRRELLTAGDRKTLVVRVIAPDASTAADVSVLSDKVFGTSGDEVNLKTWYNKCSQSKLNFVPASSTDHSSITVPGVTTVTITAAVTGVSDGTVRTNVENALTAQISNWRTAFKHTMLCLPPGTSGGWIGYAWIGHYESVYNNAWCTYPSIQMHEIGHNLGLGHSGEGSRADQPYADQSGMMGYSYSNDSTKMCFNGAKMWYFGWYEPHTLEIDPLVTPSWTGNLVGPATYTGAANQMVVVKIETDPSGPQCRDCYDYYVMFNRATGFNSGTKEGQNQVLINEQGDGQTNAQSLLMAKLSAGQSYTLNNFGGRAGETVTITVNSIDITTTNLANISIRHSSACVTDADCSDGDACNGNETCNAGTCIAGIPVTCDNGDKCDGIETCNPVDGSCSSGTPVICDNGNVCDGLETCESTTGACLPGTPLEVDDGLFCNGIETCDPILGVIPGEAPDCEAESDFCTGMKECSDEAKACVVVNPTVCEDDGDVCNGVDTCDPISQACVAGQELQCDDNDVCNGVETCDPITGCQDGTPLSCDNDDICDGIETCDPIMGCVPGTPLDCDDGLVCNGIETCDTITGCRPGEPIDCDDGNYCNGIETCVEAPGTAEGYTCQAGTPVTCEGSTECNPLICDNVSKSCIVDVANKPETCCGDGECNGDEDCTTCPQDCISGTIPGGAVCGNGVCEDGETCNNCRADCPGKTNGPSNRRFCCSGGPNGDCSNSQCGGLETCNPGSANTDKPYCCGDGVCDFLSTLGENENNCATDCVSTSVCNNDGICDEEEDLINCPNDCSCGNGTCEPELGEDSTTCAADCCGGKGASCTSGAGCCSNWCKNNGTCG